MNETSGPNAVKYLHVCLTFTATIETTQCLRLTRTRKAFAGLSPESITSRISQQSYRIQPSLQLSNLFGVNSKNEALPGTRSEICQMRRPALRKETAFDIASWDHLHFTGT